MDQTCTILIGDVRAKLLDLRHRIEAGAIRRPRCVVTSPPYWGLRDYGTEPQVWGEKADCVHDWHKAPKRHKGGTYGESDAMPGRDRTAANKVRTISPGAFCRHCGAWRGDLGLEPHPDLFVAHLVEVFRMVRDVIADDGTLWLNMGDCYATGAASQASRGARPLTNGRGEPQLAQKGFRGTRRNAEGKHGYNPGTGSIVQPNRLSIDGFKPKDLIGQPWRVAFALQADGWFLRSDIIWNKPNPMPESVTDRPTKSHEYIFLLTKSARYFYNAEAIKEDASPNSHARISQANFANQTGGAKDYKHGTNPNRSMRRTLENFARKAGVNPKASANAPGSKQNASFSAAIVAPVLSRNARTVWTFPSEPYPQAHYATFPSELPRRCILAGTQPGDVVLDPFGGSGTTGAIANAMGRDAVLIDLNPANETLMRARLVSRLINDDRKKVHCDQTGELEFGT